jgi:class 3 adenylate cyclase
LYNEQQELEAAKQANTNKGGGLQPTKAKLKNFLNQGDDAQAQNIANSNTRDVNGLILSKPIADLFPETTVLFADISKFTAWSSVRDPTQVFTLLETIYGAFDDIAARRGVFKVETIGDSYVAVTGLPEPKKDHAVVMVKFARDCRDKFTELSRILETTLGPDTGDVSMQMSSSLCEIQYMSLTLHCFLAHDSSLCDLVCTVARRRQECFAVRNLDSSCLEIR